MATATVPSASVQAKARELLARRSEWAVVRSQGMRRIVMPSASTDTVYYVDPAGRACSCPAGRKGTLCCHRIAAAEAAHEAALAQPLRTIPHAEGAAAANATSYYQQLKQREKVLRLMGWEPAEFSDDPTYSKLAEWVERAEQGGVGR